MIRLQASLTGGGQVRLAAVGVSDRPDPWGEAFDLRQLAGRLRQLTPHWSNVDKDGHKLDGGGLQAPVSWPAVVQLQAAFPDGVVGFDSRLAAWTSGEAALRGYAQADKHRLHQQLPAGLTPYPWQVQAAGIIAATGRALLADEPGTGKSASALLGILERDKLDLDPWPVIVVCPASVVDPWLEQWATWAPDVPAVAWRGPAAKRRLLAGQALVYVVSYNLARTDIGLTGGPTDRTPLLGLGARSLVVDEFHLMKDQQAQRSRAVRRLARTIPAGLAGGTVVGLSGTPITHHPGDLWPMLNSLDPDAWPSRERFVDRYCEVAAGEYADEILGLRRDTEPEFRVCLYGQHRRVAKADVLADLPPKVYSIRTVELPPRWRKAYDDMETDMIAQLPQADDGSEGGELSVMATLALMTRLAQLASAAADVTVTEQIDEETGEVTEHTQVQLKAPSWKVDALLEVLAERPGQPVVAAAPSRQLMQLAGNAATAQGLRVGYVIGGQTAQQRSDTIAAFQAGRLDLLCLTTGAGGVGITLTAARTLVFLQRPWSLVEALQTEDRLHRIGAEQHESVEIIDVIAVDTIDSRVRSVLRRRAGALTELLQDPRIAAEVLGGSSVVREQVAA